MILKTDGVSLYGTKSNLVISKHAVAFPATTGIIATQRTGETEYYGINPNLVQNIGLWSHIVQIKLTQGDK